jgi:hypothetical protein
MRVRLDANFLVRELHSLAAAATLLPEVILMEPLGSAHLWVVPDLVILFDPVLLTFVGNGLLGFLGLFVENISHY